MGGVKYPYGNIDTFDMSVSGDQDFEITNQFTVIGSGEVGATGDRTINLTIGAELKKGARILVVSATAGTQQTIFGTNMLGQSITGVTNKTFTKEFFYGGGPFVAINEQIN